MHEGFSATRRIIPSARSIAFPSVKALSVTLAPGKTEGIKVDQIDYADLDEHDKLGWILFENVLVPQDRWAGRPEWSEVVLKMGSVS